MKDLIKKNTLKIKDEIIQIRRYLHMNPELGFNEYNTSKFIENKLNSYGIRTKTNIAKTGVLGILEGKNKGKTLAFRADMDALPINEMNDNSFNSIKDGIMHACGHDIHMSLLLGTAKLLADFKYKIKGKIVFIFQPGEEGFAGAKEMIKESVLKNPKIDMIIAAHVSPSFLTGQISVSRGYSMASTTEFEITITGKEGHAAQPSKCISPISPATEVVQKINKLKNNLYLKNSVIAITSFKSGNAHNIIPKEAKLIGTVRTFEPSINYKIFKKIDSLLKSITKKTKTKYNFFYEVNYPPVYNDNNTVDYLIKSAKEILDSDNIFDNSKPLMLAEDFSYYTKKIPGAIFHLGCSTKNNLNQNLHSGTFDPDENCIEIGINIMTTFAFNFLNKNL